MLGTPPPSGYNAGALNRQTNAAMGGPTTGIQSNPVLGNKIPNALAAPQMPMGQPQMTPAMMPSAMPSTMPAPNIGGMMMQNPPGVNQPPGMVKPQGIDTNMLINALRGGQMQ